MPPLVQAYIPANLLALWHWTVALQILWWQHLCAILRALFGGLHTCRKRRESPPKSNVVDPLQRRATFRMGQQVRMSSFWLDPGTQDL
jgi:hypothetical protein